MVQTSSSKTSSRASSSSSSTSKNADFGVKTLAVIKKKGYTIERRLAAGAFGVVYKAVNSEGQHCAVKVIDLEQMTDTTKRKFLPREIDTLIECRHENLIAVYDIFRAANKIFIFMELAINGDLAAYARKHKGVREELAVNWFYQTTCGLAYLHEQLWTVHRDIKLDNILLDGNWIAKLTDLGFAKQCLRSADGSLILCKTVCGTVPYECPQLLEHRRYDAFKADIWAMGVCLYVLLFTSFPFYFRDRKVMLAEMHNHPAHLRMRYPRKLPREATKLIERLLHPEELKRGSVQTILKNGYVLAKLK